MSWWGYVQRVAKTSRQRDITDVTSVDATEVTRWKAGKVPSPLKAAAFARGYGRPVLEAFVAAEFLTATEAGERPAAEPDLTQLTNDELLELVRARMRERGETGGDTAATSEAGAETMRLAAALKERVGRTAEDEKSVSPDESSENHDASA